MSTRRSITATTAALALLVALSGCKGSETNTESTTDAAATASASTASTPEAAPATTATPEQPGPAATAPGGTEIDRLLAYMPTEPLAVAYDRLSKRFDAEALAVVYGIPPKAADLLDERQTLDEAIELVFDDDAWLRPTSFAFTVALAKSPYFVRPLNATQAELEALFDKAGFSKNTIDGVELWLPSGSFPWRIALLDGEVAAFIPVEVPGAGLEPLTGAEPSPGATSVEAEIRRSLGDDPLIELVLVSSGPLVHFDVKQSIAQVQFALRSAGPNAPAYEGQIVLAPSGDVGECVNDLRARTHPEEDHQIQTLIGEVEFVVAEGSVIGRLVLDADRLKHVQLR